MPRLGVRSTFYCGTRNISSSQLIPSNCSPGYASWAIKNVTIIFTALKQPKTDEHVQISVAAGLTPLPPARLALNGDILKLCLYLVAHQ